MAFYELSKVHRVQLVAKIYQDILRDSQSATSDNTFAYYADEDTYIRKAAYQSTGKLYQCNEQLQAPILLMLDSLLQSGNEKIRQTAVNAAGEIGMKTFEPVVHFFDQGLFDEHHSVRNAVIGSVKKMGDKNPKPVLEWAKRYLHHPDKEIRREICHGIELRGRTHPEAILPLLQELEWDTTARVRNTLVHVLGQIAYKKGCLATVIAHLHSWENKALVQKALVEIIDVHERYKNFSALTQEEAINYINKHLTN